MLRNLHITSILILMLLILTGCTGVTTTPLASSEGLLLPMSTEADSQATLAVELTQQKNDADIQAAATAGIALVNAQATLSSANATLGAALTQDQNNTDAIAAQIAMTSEIVRANAQATLDSAGSTQSAALTQSQYDLQVTIAAGTQAAAVLVTQQNKNDLAASTQTAVANTIATQTQSAAATSQWYADQSRQREEERQGPISFLWMWCLPMFVVLFAGLILWGVWRWIKIQQSNQRILENPIDRLPAPVTHPHHDNLLPYLDSDIVDSGSQLTTPDDQVDQWLDEVKDKLLKSDEKDKDDNTDN